MITVSWNHFGELKGDIGPSQITDGKGGEFELLKDPECVLGTQITQADGSVPSEIAAMVEAGRNDSFARKLCHTGF